MLPALMELAQLQKESNGKKKFKQCREFHHFIKFEFERLKCQAPFFTIIFW